MIVGVANEQFEKDSVPEYGNFWGISPFACVKITPNSTDNYDPTPPFKNGDKLGLLLEYKSSNTASLKFTINDNPLDVEIEGLTGVLYPVVSFMSSLGSATLIPISKPPNSM